MLKVSKVKRNSIAKALGIEKGDEITAFNSLPCEDELDYLYFTETDGFTMSVKNRRNGEVTDVTIEKNEGEDIGLEFAKNTEIKRCHNRCLFCFVDQMPKGMRESLYVKDDDYSMSFQCGNFVTLTNLCEEGLERIIRLKLSPLYISVHTMREELRVKLLRNRFAGKIVEQIRRLAEGGIQMHCQAVIVPGENDGDELAYTARALFKYYPLVKDLACVPTGLTKYRTGLHPIDDIDKPYSEKLLDLVDELNKEFGVNFLLPADEYFIKAERPFKDEEFYGDFSQIENGIGLTTKFIAEAKDALARLAPCVMKKPKTALIVSGTSAHETNERLAKACESKIHGLRTVVLPVENDFFGHTVTCTGLLVGKDIARAVQEYVKQNGKVDEVIIAGNTLKEFEDVFLCGMKLKELRARLAPAKVIVNRDGGRGLVEILSKRR